MINEFTIGVAVGVGGTYAVIRFLPVILQDIKLVAYKAWDSVKNSLKRA